MSVVSARPPLQAALDGLEYTPARSAALLAGINEQAATLAPLETLRSELELNGVRFTGDALERALIARAAAHASSRLATLRLYDGVRRLLTRELETYAAPDAPLRTPLTAGSFEFLVAAKVTTFRRFPAGPIDWELHGLSRSTLLRVPWRDLPATLACLAFEFRGFTPAFFLHIAQRPRNRTLILRREVQLAFYRIARSMALQPEIRGIVAIAWFLDPAAVRDNPHLEYLNEPFRAGGHLTTAGFAPADAGFLERNEQRRRQFEAGELRYRLGVGLWPRAAALAWIDAHPDLDGH
jgi:hypothetical protein